MRPEQARWADASREAPRVAGDVDWTRFWGFWGRPAGMAFIRLYFRWRLRSYRRLLDAARREAVIETALEMGAGAGILARTLSRRYPFDFTLVDNCPAAHRLYRRHSGAGRYLREDLFQHRGLYDLVYSDGVVEHFDVEQRIEAIRRHKDCARRHVVIFVPKKSFLTRHLLLLSQTGGDKEAKFTRGQFLEEVRRAGLTPLKTTEDIHMIGVWAR